MQDQYEGNKDVDRARLHGNEKVDGYEEGEMRSVWNHISEHNMLLAKSKKTISSPSGRKKSMSIDDETPSVNGHPMVQVLNKRDRDEVP
ncbi:hypothetical protein Tco_1049517 [Tanacetum coccineum]